MNKYTKNENLPYKVFCKNLADIHNRFSIGGIGITEVKEIPSYFNMLFLKDDQFTVVCEDGKFYLVTV